MEQLVFDLAAPEPLSFDNFVTGANVEAVAAVKRFATVARGDETSLLLSGEAGAGKSHLLQAAALALQTGGRRATYLSDPAELLASEVEALSGQELVAVDRVDMAAPDAQAHLFTLYNALRASGARLLAASRRSLASLAMREDVRTRLGWGLVYALAPLSDAEKPAALLAYSQARGFRLSEDVIRYLLAHGRRDMTTLLATLAALDRHSLSAKRAITVPLLRDWLQRDMPLGNG